MSEARPCLAIVLAAGEGKRMKSSLPKVMHEVAGKPLLAHVGEAARESGADRILVVIGNGADLVRESFAGKGWEFVEQTERLGTGDAVRRARAQLEEFEGDVMVLAGDVPLLQGSTLARLLSEHRGAGAAATVLTARIADPTGYGRIVRSKESGAFLGIVEHRDATEEQLAIDEINSSVYCFDAASLRSVLWRIGTENAQGEVYLTDAIGLLRDDGRAVQAVAAATPEEILGINTVDQLREIEDILSRREAGTREEIR